MKKDRPEIIEAKARMLDRLPATLHCQEVAEILNVNGRRQIGWLLDEGLLQSLVTSSKKQFQKEFHLCDIIDRKFDREWNVKARKVIKERTRKNNGYLSCLLDFFFNF